MVHHYKMGNISEAKRIQHMLDGNKKEVNIKIDDDNISYYLKKTS